MTPILFESNLFDRLTKAFGAVDHHNEASTLRLRYSLHTMNGGCINGHFRYIQWYREGQMTVLDETIKALQTTLSSISQDEEEEDEVERNESFDR